MRRAGALLLFSLAACSGRESEATSGGASSAEVDTPEPAPSASLSPQAPPRGMIWIPPGVLLAGTPPTQLPRMTDAEMPGAQVVMRGFFIDELPFPNESGAIPRTGLSRDEAQELCTQQGKRLCTELEWERACKGPDNRTYPYGNTYHAEDCGTSAVHPRVPPVGLLANCKSSFGVRDLVGSVGQWTASSWGRGTDGNLTTVRGEPGDPGEVFSRCAHATARRPADRAPTMGVRCCTGDRNLGEVTLTVSRGEPLSPYVPREADQKLVSEHPPPDLASILAPSRAPFRLLQAWRWRPAGNEELLVLSGCANPGPMAMCGVTAYRPSPEGAQPLAFVPSGWWLPALHDSDDPRDLYVFGGDKDGGFRRHLGYSYGRVTAGPPERNIGKKKKKRGREAP